MTQSKAEYTLSFYIYLYSYINLNRLGYAAVTNNLSLFQGLRLREASTPCYKNCQDKVERGDRRRVDNSVPLTNSQIFASAHIPLAKPNG